MNLFALVGALEIGLVYAFVSCGVFLTFRVLNFPDLTVEGSFPFGAAVAAVAILNGIDPWLALLFATIAGFIMGAATAFLVVQCGIVSILASILTMIAAFSINIRVMGRPNISLLGEMTIFTPFTDRGWEALWFRPLLVGVILFLVVAMLVRFLVSEFGLAIRAVGSNSRMVEANGGNRNTLTYIALAISNGLVALSGALFAQTNGFADVTIGVGTIVVGLASVVVGTTLLPGRSILSLLVACVIGSILYRIAVAAAIHSGVVGLQATDLNLITAVIVALALMLPNFRSATKLASLFPPRSKSQ